MNKIFRQGDVLIMRIDEMPQGAVKAKPQTRVTLARGEVTGHAHVLCADGAAILPYTVQDRTDELFFELMDDAFIQHEEHAAIALPAGMYRVVRQREYTPQEIRRVAD